MKVSNKTLIFTQQEYDALGAIIEATPYGVARPIVDLIARAEQRGAEREAVRPKLAQAAKET